MVGRLSLEPDRGSSQCSPDHVSWWWRGLLHLPRNYTRPTLGLRSYRSWHTPDETSSARPCYSPDNDSTASFWNNRGKPIPECLLSGFLLQLGMMEVVHDNWSCKTRKAPVKSSPPTKNIQLFTYRMPILSHNQHCQSS